MSQAPKDIILITLETMPEGQAIQLGQMVTASVVQAGNVVRDMREFITNLIGGRMQRYENLLDAAMERGTIRFREKLAEQGYDGALGVRFLSPKIVDGGVELVIFGTGFRYIDQPEL